MSINQLPPSNSSGLNPNSSSEAASVSFFGSLEAKKMSKGSIKNMVMGMAEIAASMGQTNDIEGYAEMMSEDIYESIKKVERKKKRKKGNTP
ncbi:MAG: hypothetical protein VW378_01555 [bacterium]